MAKKKKEPEPVELQEVPHTKWSRTKGFVKGNEKSIWRLFLTAMIGVATLISTNGKDWVEKYLDNQRKQIERQVGWQVKAEARHQALLRNDSIAFKNDSIIISLIKSKTKIR